MNQQNAIDLTATFSFDHNAFGVAALSPHCQAFYDGHSYKSLTAVLAALAPCWHDASLWIATCPQALRFSGHIYGMPLVFADNPLPFTPEEERGHIYGLFLRLLDMKVAAGCHTATPQAQAAPVPWMAPLPNQI